MEDVALKLLTSSKILGKSSEVILSVDKRNSLTSFSRSGDGLCGMMDTTTLSVGSRRQIISVACRVHRVAERGNWNPVKDSRTLDFPALWSPTTTICSAVSKYSAAFGDGLLASHLRQRHEVGYSQLAKLVHLVQKSTGSKSLARLVFIRRGIHL